MTTPYLIVSVLLGFAQMVDAVLLWRTNGRVTVVVQVFSTLELIWAAISLFAWFKIEAPAWFPLSFTAYTAAMFTWGLVQRRRIATEGLPRSAMLAGGGFGLYFFATGLGLLLSR